VKGQNHTATNFFITVLILKILQIKASHYEVTLTRKSLLYTAFDPSGIFPQPRRTIFRSARE